MYKKQFCHYCDEIVKLLKATCKLMEAKRYGTSFDIAKAEENLRRVMKEVG